MIRLFKAKRFLITRGRECDLRSAACVRSTSSYSSHVKQSNALAQLSDSRYNFNMSRRLIFPSDDGHHNQLGIFGMKTTGSASHSLASPVPLIGTVLCAPGAPRESNDRRTTRSFPQTRPFGHTCNFGSQDADVADLAGRKSRAREGELPMQGTHIPDYVQTKVQWAY